MKVLQNLWDKTRLNLGIKKLLIACANGLSDIFNQFNDSLFTHENSKYQTLIKRQISKILVENFGGDEGQNTNHSQYFLGYGLLHYSVIRNLRPKNTLVIGSRRGFIPAICALACKDNVYGHVDFVDAGYGPENPDKHWSGVGFWKKNNPLTHFSKLRVEKYINTYVMTTRQYRKQFPLKKYQYIYVDGDHSYKGVKTDYQLFWPSLDRGGFIVFHDVVAKGYIDKGKFGVYKFWKEIKDKHKTTFPLPKESGLGILQKQ